MVSEASPNISAPRFARRSVNCGVVDLEMCALETSMQMLIMYSAASSFAREIAFYSYVLWKYCFDAVLRGWSKSDFLQTNMTRSAAQAINPFFFYQARSILYEVGTDKWL